MRSKPTLLQRIEEKKDCARFHTPGHSGSSPDASFDELYSSAKFDVTELAYSDNLLGSSSSIKEIEKVAAKIFGASASYIFTQGATSAVHCAVFAASTDGKFMVLGGGHKSVYNGLRLAGASAIQASIDIDIDLLIKEIECNNVRTIIATSPNYKGEIIADELCKKLKATFPSLQIIVDASHGAHFAFSKFLPVSLPKYADLVIHSLHKTLPVFTGGAILHTTENYIEKVGYYRNLLHSSSPFYPTILSIEATFRLYKKQGERIYKGIKDEIDKFKGVLPSYCKVLTNADFSRLVIECTECDGREVYNALASLGYYGECADNDTVIFILTANNIAYLPKLGLALQAIMPTLSRKKSGRQQLSLPNAPFALQFYKDFYLIDIKDSIGKICYTEIGLYPPGTPFLFSGQEITKTAADFMAQHESELFGLVKGKVCVVK